MECHSAQHFPFMSVVWKAHFSYTCWRVCIDPDWGIFEYCPGSTLIDSCKIVSVPSVLALLVFFSPGKLALAQNCVWSNSMYFFHVRVLISPLGTDAPGKCCSLTGSLVLTEAINSNLLLPVMLPWCKTDLNWLFEISLLFLPTNSTYRIT